MTNYLSQIVGESEKADETMLAQTEATDDELLAKVATFMAQLDEDELDSMETYLMQMEQATENGD